MGNDHQHPVVESKYPASEYSQTQFNFTKGEWMRLVSMDTLVNQGEVAKALINQLVNGEVFKRVGIKDARGMSIEYNIAEGTFSVFTPKNLCSVCKKEKATHEFGGKKSCESCLPILQMVKGEAK